MTIITMLHTYKLAKVLNSFAHKDHCQTQLKIFGVWLYRRIQRSVKQSRKVHFCKFKLQTLLDWKSSFTNVSPKGCFVPPKLYNIQVTWIRLGLLITGNNTIMSMDWGRENSMHRIFPGQWLGVEKLRSYSCENCRKDNIYYTTSKSLPNKNTGYL